MMLDPRPRMVSRPSLGFPLASALLVAASPAALAASLEGDAGDARAGAVAADTMVDTMQAQTPSAPQSDTEPDSDGETIVVRAEQLRGSIRTDVPPVAELNAQDVASYGASSLAELLQQIAPQTGSARGRGGDGPVVLLNGQRVSGFRAIRDIPPEAIAKVEVFPEELALKYGFRPDQRVINFILVDNYQSLAAEIDNGLSTQGGYGTTEFEGTFTKLGKNTRLIVDVEYEMATALRESERGIIQPDSTAPFALGGNVGASPFATGAEISPALSALAGRPVSLAGVPQGLTGAPAMSAFNIPANTTDLGEFRTLVPNSDRIQANATYIRTLGPDTNVQVNATYTNNFATSLLGLNTATLTVPAANPFNPFGRDVSLLTAFGDPRTITRTVDTDTYSFGFNANGVLPANWKWALTGDYTRVDTLTIIDQPVDASGVQAAISRATGAVNPFTGTLGSLLPGLISDTAQSRNQFFNSQLTANGKLADLPAGPVNLTLVGGFARRLQDSVDSRRAGQGSVSLTRSEANVSANIDVPLVDTYMSDWFGKLSVNGNLGYRELSDIGGLLSFGYGLNWSPTDTLTLQASLIGEEAAPGISQLGDPQIVTPNVSTFDLARNETVLATIISGGNPLLTAEERRDVKISLNYRPPFVEGLDFLAEFIRNRSYGTTSSFPVLTPEIEAAFPDRIIRDTDGRLLAIDQRAINYDRVTSDRLRYGINFSRRIGGDDRGGAGGRGAGSPPRGAAGAGGPPPNGPGGARAGAGGPPRGPGAGGPPRGPSGGFGPGAGGRGGRWNISVYHTVRFAETIRIRPGLAELDLLNGSAIGSSGGVPRHGVEMEGGLFLNGIGLRFTGNYQSGSRVDGGGLVGATDLRFNDIATFGMRAFVNFDNKPKLTEAVPFLKGSRLRLGVDNIFNAQQRVTNEAGEVPLRYQPGFIDPQGRVVSLSFRKRF
ncbi:TonB-dependent receptor-like protein [Blastomonas natatoria]|uniref:TonB-dependent receptor-like protein n=1 Tax=Blastomonas natatoria TaxID=34015 RepID=A0A2V3VPG2_9SPHN|nr:TonB-dependent receptor plug domain-containing protein [Blastomonas natatoria]PXW78429.1 TonB-dependent receptor-like protein [Blastomonas natatoria]